MKSEESETANIERRLVPMWDSANGSPLCGSRARIVVGVDETASSLSALRWAAREARFDRRHLHVIHVVGSREEVDRDVLTTFIRGAFEGTAPVDIESATIVSKAPEALVAASHNASLLVLGAHTKEHHFWEMYASVPERAASFATCPVVIVGPGEDHPHKHHGRIVVAVDDSFTARDAIAWAAEEAIRRTKWAGWVGSGERYELSVLWQTPRLGKWVVKREELEELLYQEALGGLIGLDVSVENPSAPYELGIGKTALTLTEASQVADLLVIGAASHETYTNLAGVLEKGGQAEIQCLTVIVPEAPADRNRGATDALVDIEKAWAKGFELNFWFEGSDAPVREFR